MGLNLSIKRIVFYSLLKTQTPNTIKYYHPRRSISTDFLTTSQALQIAGRAGRYRTLYEDGFVTTFSHSDLDVLMEILKMPMEKTQKAGLHPTPDQIELFSYQLPNHSLSQLLNIFISLCKIDDSKYFLCNYEAIKLAELVDQIKIPLIAKYTFCTSPITTKEKLISSCFVKFVRYYSKNEPVTAEILQDMIKWPLPPNSPVDIDNLKHLEVVYDVLDLYLWLSFRFKETFIDTEIITQMRLELEEIIFKGVGKLLSNNKLKRNSSKSNDKHLVKATAIETRENLNAQIVPNEVKGKYEVSKETSPIKSAGSETKKSKK